MNERKRLFNRLLENKGNFMQLKFDLATWLWLFVIVMAISSLY